MKVGRKAGSPAALDETRTVKAAPGRRRGADGSAGKRRPVEGSTGKRHPAEAPARKRRGVDASARSGRTRPPHDARGPRQGPQTAPVARPVDRPARPKTASQAKARAKARKAKAPKVIRPSLRERLILKLEGVDLRPQVLLARIPFVMLVIGALALGLGITLWLSTASAQRSYQLGSARAVNDALAQQKEALERDVLEAQSAPALADAARDLGMIPSRDTAHLVQDPAGNWVVIGSPKPAAGAPPPPLNTKLPDPTPPAPPQPAPTAATAPKPGASVEVPRRVTPALPGTAPTAGIPTLASPEVPVMVPGLTTPGSVSTGSAHAPIGVTLPGPAPLPVPAVAPLAGDTLGIAPAVPGAIPVPTVAAVPVVPDVAAGVVAAGPAQ
jgi:hypothetical protein